MSSAPSLALAFDAGDVQGAVEAALAHLNAGESLRDLYLAAARAAVRKYWYESLEFGPLHALMSIDAAYSLRTWLPESSEAPFAEDASPASGLALIQAIAYVAETHPGPERPTKPARPTLGESTPDAMGNRLIEYIKAGNLPAADGMLDLMLSFGGEISAVARALFTAASLDAGGWGHKLIFATHCWRMAEADPGSARYDLLRPAVHFACTKGPSKDMSRVYPIAKRLSVDVPPLPRRKPPGHSIVVADLLLNDEPATTFVRAFDDQFGVNDLVDAVIVAACASIMRGGDLHSFTYAHAARLAIEATQGRALLALFQAGLRDEERWRVFAIPVPPIDTLPKKNYPRPEELALWAAMDDCGPNYAHRMKFTAGIVGELQRMPVELHPYLYEAWLTLWSGKPGQRTIAGMVPGLTKNLRPPSL